MDDRRRPSLTISCSCARRLSLPLLLLWLMCATSPLSAQQAELSTADRLRMLYTTQLTFTVGGDPVIRLGLMEGVTSMEFTPSEPIRVLPNGERGAVVELPADKTYRVSVSDPSPGRYKHWVVVERLPVAQRQRQAEIQKTWLARGYAVEPFEVGGLFAVKGKVFDSRVILLAVSGSEDRAAAARTQRKLQDTFGVEASLHSELVEHPSALISLTFDGGKVAVRHRDILQVVARPSREELIRYKIPNIKKNYSKDTETRTYTSALIFAPDRDGGLVVINSLGAERALRGTVPAEIFASAPPAALQAQAIAARNEIFSGIGVRNLADPYMLRADVMDQVYGGVGAEDPRTDAAVEATRGQIMFYGEQIVEAFYSSNAGGFTEDNENVWDMAPRPYLRGKADAPAKAVPAVWRDGVSEAQLPAFLKEGFAAYSRDAPASSARAFRWERSVPVSEPQGWLKEAGHKIGAIKDVQIVKRGRSGRVVRLKVVGERGEATIERELNVRRLFGGLRSGLFTMTVDRDTKGRITQLHFNGAGFGHGVGMCQTGAIGMAAKGSSATQILTHYYTGISIKNLY